MSEHYETGGTWRAGVEVMRLREEIAAAPSCRGRTAYGRYLAGEDVGRKNSIQSMCFCCSDYYRDGRADCQHPTCPLYPYMPYRERGQNQAGGSDAA